MRGIVIHTFTNKVVSKKRAFISIWSNRFDKWRFYIIVAKNWRFVCFFFSHVFYRINKFGFETINRFQWSTATTTNSRIQNKRNKRNKNQLSCVTNKITPLFFLRLFVIVFVCKIVVIVYLNPRICNKILFDTCCWRHRGNPTKYSKPRPVLCSLAELSPNTGLLSCDNIKKGKQWNIPKTNCSLFILHTLHGVNDPFCFVIKL